MMLQDGTSACPCVSDFHALFLVFAHKIEVFGAGGSLRVKAASAMP